MNNKFDLFEHLRWFADMGLKETSAIIMDGLSIRVLDDDLSRPQTYKISVDISASIVV